MASRICQGSVYMKPAVVMNMFYSGLAIARSLGQHGVPIIGLSSEKRAYGNYTRFAKVRMCPDSRSAPSELLEWLLALGAGLGQKSVIFPTRDHDVVFLDRFREQLAPHFIPVIPNVEALRKSLDKWETFRAAAEAGIDTPWCLVVASEAELHRLLPEIRYPCVLKPLAAHYWRSEDNWETVGGRKAIAVASESELLAEYGAVAQADGRVLIQEMIPGDDDQFLIAACCMDRNSECAAAFNTQKLVQVPQGFGTGCVVQTADYPELIDKTAKLLRHIGFSGIAEVEYKRDSEGRFRLIEINPRPWDQHSLGNACGVDLMWTAYADCTGLPRPVVQKRSETYKWIAEDTFFMYALHLLRRRSPALRPLLRHASGKRVYAIWSLSDPVPFLVYAVTGIIPRLIVGTAHAVRSAMRRQHSAGTGGPAYRKGAEHV